MVLMAAVAKFVDNVVQNCQEKQEGHRHLNWHQFIISHFMQKQQKWEMIGSLLVCLCMGLQLDASGGLFPSTSKDEIFPPFPFFFAGYITASFISLSGSHSLSLMKQFHTIQLDWNNISASHCLYPSIFFAFAVDILETFSFLCFLFCTICMECSCSCKILC